MIGFCQTSTKWERWSPDVPMPSPEGLVTSPTNIARKTTVVAKMVAPVEWKGVMTQTKRVTNLGACASVPDRVVLQSGHVDHGSCHHI